MPIWQRGGKRIPSSAMLPPSIGDPSLYPRQGRYGNSRFICSAHSCGLCMCFEKTNPVQSMGIFPSIRNEDVSWVEWSGSPACAVYMSTLSSEHLVLMKCSAQQLIKFKDMRTSYPSLGFRYLPKAAAAILSACRYGSSMEAVACFFCHSFRRLRAWSGGLFVGATSSTSSVPCDLIP